MVGVFYYRYDVFSHIDRLVAEGTLRLCACGCGQIVRNYNSKYVDASHRKRVAQNKFNQAQKKRKPGRKPGRKPDMVKRKELLRIAKKIYHWACENKAGHWLQKRQFAESGCCEDWVFKDQPWQKIIKTLVDMELFRKRRKEGWDIWYYLVVPDKDF